ncbi:cycle protein 20 homolog [Seminavis robusta]|uniref:Cycle protein 20 homolog n=1 Tax=Seminavis robusta TaxID=568900 RepID=A0A9N8EBW0_9STRA|nr:cycle protein 20 homolog [Seminavis robusta]|eukprot:Sro865_g212830.1 cycle protein 20 homolog (465) ;mRNA; f:20722-22116
MTPANNKKRSTMMTPARRVRTSRRHMPTMTMAAPDRFIPSRAKTDASKVRRALLANGASSKSEDECYNKQLREVLFQDDAENDRLLHFSSATTTKRDAFRTQAGTIQSPFVHGVGANVSNSVKKAKTTQQSRILPLRKLDAPGYLVDKGLRLMSSGPSLAVALHDRLYLWNDGSVQCVNDTDDDDECISCVCWSPNGKYIAVGKNGSIEVWCPKRCQLVAKATFYQQSWVTAIAWHSSSNQLVAANAAGINRYTISDNSVSLQHVARYKGHGDCESEVVLSLVWTPDYLFSAATDGEIRIWEKKQKVDETMWMAPIPPVRILKQPGVAKIKAHPMQPHLLYCGGDDGIECYDARSATKVPRRCIEMQEEKVTDFVLSPFDTDECVVAVDNELTLFSFTRNSKVIERFYSKEKIGDYLCLDGGKDGTVLGVGEQETIAMMKVFRRPRKVAVFKTSAMINGLSGVR